MTTTWSPCEVGKALYEAYEQLAGKPQYRVYRTITQNKKMLEAWRAWVAHRDNCERCKVTK